jgi:hypothetical protein
MGAGEFAMKLKWEEQDIIPGTLCRNIMGEKFIIGYIPWPVNEPQSYNIIHLVDGMVSGKRKSKSELAESLTRSNIFPESFSTLMCTDG